MSFSANVESVLTDVKTGAATATATTGVGAGTWFDFIPADIGKLASLVGMLLSCVLIYTHIMKYRTERRRDKLMIEALARNSQAS
jgi:inorganic pyrophosphatase/exopolyphosphatase